VSLSADLTLRSLTLGAADATTGWCRRTYADSTIKGVIRNQGSTFILGNFGLHAKYPCTLFTSSAVAVGDEIVDAFTHYYRVDAVEREPLLNSLAYYVCKLTELPMRGPRADTSGTWHLDSDALKSDECYKTLVWLDDHITDANIKEDDGITNAAWLGQMENPDYPVYPVLKTIDIDVLMCVGKTSTKALYDYNYTPYAFECTVPIASYAIDKPNVTAVNVLEQAEQEIRHVATDYPLGSVRSIESITHKPVDLGECLMWGTTVNLRYKRWNDDYTPTLPTLTYGSGGTAGTFTFPAVKRLTFKLDNRDDWMDPVAFSGEMAQALGSNSFQVEVVCDADVSPTAKTWKRPQATSPKTDSSEVQVFLDMLHEEGIDEEYHTLTVPQGNFKVRVVSAEQDMNESGNVITVLLKEYRSTSASTQTITQRLGGA